MKTKINQEVTCKRNHFGYWNLCKGLPNFVNIAALVRKGFNYLFQSLFQQNHHRQLVALYYQVDEVHSCHVNENICHLLGGQQQQYLLALSLDVL